MKTSNQRFSAQDLHDILCDNLAKFRSGKISADKLVKEYAAVREISRLFNVRLKAAAMVRHLTPDMADFLGAITEKPVKTLRSTSPRAIAGRRA